VGLVFLGLGALTACSSIEVGLGLRARLDKVPVTAVSAPLSPDPGLSPGKSGRLVITATTSDAKQLVTVGAGHGNVLFDSFTFTATAVTVSKKGVVSLPADPRVSEGAAPHIPAGTIIVSVDAQTQLYLNKLQLINTSGSGVSGPKPDIRIETVAPIW
jgi:hypothetical protein